MAEHSEKLVSVIIPTFNDAHFLDSTLAKLARQSHPHLQIIVVDDGSTDNTRELVEQHQLSLNILYLWQRNAGPGAARNSGLACAKGEFVQFLDADDFLDSRKIELQLAIVTAPTEIPYSDYRVFQDGDETRYSRPGPAHVDLPNIDLSAAFNQWTVLHRFLFPVESLRVIGGFDTTLSHAEDLDLWLRLISSQAVFKYQDFPLAFYRFRRGRSVTGKAQEYASKLEILRRIELATNENRWVTHTDQIVTERDKLLKFLSAM